MATYVVGDIHGCFQTFEHLLRQINFRDHVDQIWFVGDLVNRGPDSLSILRWAAHRDALCVLGNHDLTCLAAYCSEAQVTDQGLQAVLKAPDVAELMTWFRRQPLMYWDEEVILVHAGFHPGWDFTEACRRARALETHLRGSDWKTFLREVTDRSAVPSVLSESIGYLTRIRMCRADGTAALTYKGRPEEAPDGFEPWYRRSQIVGGLRTVYFGHWAAHGHRVEPGLVALDDGCVWGGHLVAIRLEDGHVERVRAHHGDMKKTPR